MANPNSRLPRAARRDGRIAEQTLSRRTWMEWIGRASVLGLGAGLLARCTAGGPPPIRDASADGGSRGDASSPADASADASADARTGALCDQPTDPLPFSPGELQGIQSWNVRTVDQQSLESLLATWKLEVSGMVATPRVLTFADLFCLPRQDQVTDFHCVEGWSVYDVPWNGVHLSHLISAAGGAAQAATHITFHTVGDTYNESLPLSVALEPKTLLGYGVGGNTLPLDHGFPLRLVVPRLLAYKSAKYVYGVELTDHPVDGFWVKNGYPYDAEVPASRLRPGKY